MCVVPLAVGGPPPQTSQRAAGVKAVSPRGGRARMLFARLGACANPDRAAWLGRDVEGHQPEHLVGQIVGGGDVNHSLSLDWIKHGYRGCENKLGGWRHPVYSLEPRHWQRVSELV